MSFMTENSPAAAPAGTAPAATTAPAAPAAASAVPAKRAAALAEAPKPKRQAGAAAAAPAAAAVPVVDLAGAGKPQVKMSGILAARREAKRLAELARQSSSGLSAAKPAALDSLVDLT